MQSHSQSGVTTVVTRPNTSFNYGQQGGTTWVNTKVAEFRPLRVSILQLRSREYLEARKYTKHHSVETTNILQNSFTISKLRSQLPRQEHHCRVAGVGWSEAGPGVKVAGDSEADEAASTAGDTDSAADDTAVLQAIRQCSRWYGRAADDAGPVGASTRRSQTRGARRCWACGVRESTEEAVITVDYCSRWEGERWSRKLEEGESPLISGMLGWWFWWWCSFVQSVHATVRCLYCLYYCKLRKNCYTCCSYSYYLHCLHFCLTYFMLIPNYSYYS